MPFYGVSTYLVAVHTVCSLALGLELLGLQVLTAQLCQVLLPAKGKHKRTGEAGVKVSGL